MDRRKIKTTAVKYQIFSDFDKIKQMGIEMGLSDEEIANAQKTHIKMDPLSDNRVSHHITFEDHKTFDQEPDD